MFESSIFPLSLSDIYSGMLFHGNSNPNLKKFEIHQSDFYSLDKAGLYEISSPEVWDFSEAKEIQFEFIPFLIMRAILHKKITNEPIQLNNLPFIAKQNISKFSSSIPLNEFFSGTFFPSIVGSKGFGKLEFYKKFIANYSFYKEIVNTYYVICGGGILEKSNTLLKPFIQELFEVFNLENHKGKFYFRNSQRSYFYPLSPENKSRLFFVQERNFISIPFHFFYIELERK